MNRNKYDYVIVGAGAYGLSTAFYLAETGARILLLQKYQVGHSHGSSHGATRISRSTYQNAFYRDLNILGINEYWPYMQKKLEGKFVHPTQFILYNDNPDMYVQYYKLSKELYGDTCFFTPKEICQKFPNMPLVDCPHRGIIDTSAGLIKSNQFIIKLRQYLLKCDNVELRENSQVVSIEEDKEKVQIIVKYDVEKIIANKVVVTAGKWIKSLFPSISGILKIVKQYTAFIEIENMEKYQQGKLPCFAHKKRNHQFFYLPSVNNQGFKVGIHNLSDVNMTSQVFEEIVRQNAVQLFGDKFMGIKKVQPCFYTVTKSQNFVIDWIDPQNERILIASCCSGHGFKFSAILGKVISDLIRTNKSINLYEQYKHVLSIPFHHGVDLQ